MRRILALTEGFYASPLLLDGVMYVADYAGTVIAIDPITGRPKWARPVETPHGVTRGLDLVAQGKDLVVCTKDGQVSVLRRSDGTRVTDTYIVRGPLACAPALVGDDDLIFASESGWLQNWGRVGGTLRWERKYETTIDRTPPTKGRGVFLSPRPLEFLAIDAKTGDTYYRYRHTPLAARVEVAGTGREFVVHGRTLFAFGPSKDGHGPAWYFEAQGKILAGPVVADGGVFIGDDMGFLYRLEASDE